jgi:6-pyruvoyltetrahydropterin/6-carboxytetrahydropterin synthase
MKKFQSTKLFDGYSACFRQWRAEGTHCRYLHSYIVKFELIFSHDKDENIFKMYPKFDIHLKNWFESTFNHKTFVAQDDPYLETFKKIHDEGIIQLSILEQVGCERFSEYVFNNVKNIIKSFEIDLKLLSVETFEHDKNSALCFEIKNKSKE